ncbi:hypothetical protein [Leclercia sp.]|uniref:hypothetical protein n=1 Tax=Leclercia sp. TaxID=1898428 RepID=UPI002FDE6356
MAILQKINATLNTVIFYSCIILFSNHEVFSSEKIINIDSNYKDKTMACDNQGSFLHVINTVVQIISQKSTIEEQLEEYKEFFDRAEAHYSKNGPVDRYYLSHKREVEINFFRDEFSNVWNSAYISFGACTGMLLDFDNIRKANLFFEGIYEKEGAYPDGNGKKVTYKFNVARYRHNHSVIVDFKLKSKEQSGEVYPIRFSQVHIYTEF